MTNPLVSVVMPAYNAEKCITETLASVFAQTYRPLEVIVVDDGSTDETARVVGSALEAFVATTGRTEHSGEASVLLELRYLYQQNGGPSKARNAGIKGARGEFIALLDADDLWMNDKMEKQVRLFLNNPQLDFVFTDAKIRKRNQDKIDEFVMFEKKCLDQNFFGYDNLVKSPLEKLLKENFIPTSSVVIRKTCFADGLLFNEDRRYAEDWEFWLQAALRYNFGYVNKICVYKDENSQGLSSNADRMLLSRIDVLEGFLKRNQQLIAIQISKDKLSRCLKDIYKWAGYYFLQNANKNSELARAFFKKSMRERFDLKTIFYFLRTFNPL